MMIFWLIILIVVIAVAWTAMQRAGRGTGPGRDRAEEALRERYARGEIDEETYRRMLNELRRP